MRSMLNTPTDKAEIFIRDLPGVQGWHRTDMMERQAIIAKYQSLISKPIQPIEAEIQRAFNTSDENYLKEIIEQQKETVALVLAMDKEMWLNQKRLWLHLEQYTHSKMWPDCIDKEIAKIEEFAKLYHLPLP
jgi:hypothetical protein